MNKYQQLLKDYIGETKPYKDWCKILGEEKANGGRNKKIQLNQWKQYIDIEPNDRQLTLVSVYDDNTIEKLAQFRYIKHLNNYYEDERYNMFKIYYKYAHDGGIYKIQSGNVIYIGQTYNFQDRFHTHMYRPAMYNFVMNGAEMSIIEIIEDKQKRLEREKEYIIHYVHNENYICINKVFSDKRKYNVE